ncbi:MAG: flagellar export chaperone FlgN [Candidatus Krumholzibacteriota bacterium]|nr:flagellar export chaperone FlgN [Candidatus Krumholzibacteriota bacterium]
MTRAEDLTALKVALAEESQHYRQLLDVSREHHEALLAGERRAVERSLQRQLQIIAGCRMSTEERRERTDALARQLGLGAPCTTGRILAALPEAGAALQREYDAMRAVSAELAALNEQNQRLVTHRLDLLQGDFAALGQLVREATGRGEGSGEPVEGSLISQRA